MNFRSMHVYNFHISKLIGTDLHLFELSVWLDSFAVSLISVFIPIILYNYGLSIKEVVVFYILFNFIDVPLNLLAEKIIKLYGARTAVIAAIFSKIVSLIIFYAFEPRWQNLIFFAITLAVYDSFYWVGHLYIFASAAHKSQTIRSDVSHLQIVRFVGAVLAPVIGAYILISTDQKTLIFTSTVVMLFSLLPLFRMRNLKFKPENPSMSFKEFFTLRDERINYFIELLAALREEMESVIWPFFIFFVYGSLRTVAYIPTLVSIASLILIYYTGKRSLPKKVYRLIALGGLLVAMIWLLRINYFANEFIAIGSVFIVSLLTIFIDIPLEITIFQRARETNELTAVTYLNLFRMFARGMLYVFLFFMVNIFTTSFYMIMIAMLLLFIISGIYSQRKELSAAT